MWNLMPTSPESTTVQQAMKRMMTHRMQPPTIASTLRSLLFLISVVIWLVTLMLWHCRHTLSVAKVMILTDNAKTFNNKITASRHVATNHTAARRAREPQQARRRHLSATVFCATCLFYRLTCLLSQKIIVTLHPISTYKLTTLQTQRQKT